MRQKERIGADIGKDDRAIAPEPIAGERKLLCRFMGGEVFKGEGAAGERAKERLSAEMKGHAAKLIKPL